MIKGNKKVENNKQLVKQFFTALEAFDVDGVMNLMSEDVDYWIQGNSPVSGHHTKEEFRQLVSGMSREFASPLKMTLIGMTAEGDRIAVEATGTATAKNGRQYNNTFHYLVEFRNGKVIQVKEYCDTKQVFDVFFS